MLSELAKMLGTAEAKHKFIVQNTLQASKRKLNQ